MKLRIVKEESEIVKYIFNLYVKEKKSLWEIVKILEEKKDITKIWFNLKNKN